MAEATHLINTRIAEIYTPGKETQLQPREAMLRAGATMVNFVAGDYETTLQHFARIQGNRETIAGLADRIELLTVASWSATRLGRPGTASEFLEEARLLIDLIEDFGATEFPPFTIARAHWNAAAG